MKRNKLASATVIVCYLIAAQAQTENEEPKPGTVGVVVLPGSVELEIVWVPAGQFWMGCSPGETGFLCDADEKPRHRVELDGFWMGKYEVTQVQWEAVMGFNPSRFKGHDRPVDRVGWSDTQEFLKKAGNGLRLPTEAEWEYACRAGSEEPRHGELDEVAWFSDNSKDETHPVGMKKPNAWGLYDMLGNVWEWCQDWYGENYYRNSPTRSPPGPFLGELRVMRGGSLVNDFWQVNASYRIGEQLNNRYYIQGFRVVVSSSKL